MKFLFPAVTIILASHMKPYLGEALASVEAQTRTDLQCLVLDSGRWIGREDPPVCKDMAEIYDAWRDHPLIEWVFTGEQENLRHRTCPISRVTNEAIRAGLVRGRYVCHFYDDDLYYPRFTEMMAGFLDANEGARAVWCTEERLQVRRDGIPGHKGAIVADGPRAGAWDCQVDGAQVMYRRELLDQIGDPWMDESQDTCHHSDGLFLEKIGRAAVVVPNIRDTLVIHRFTPLSTYSPS